MTAPVKMFAWMSEVHPHATPSLNLRLTECNLNTVITSCDDTGLAFLSDALEAQQDYSWEGGGVDPNCGRL
jgi:hypothetical protein